MKKLVLLSLMICFSAASAYADIMYSDGFGNYNTSNGTYIQKVNDNFYTTSNGGYAQKLNDNQWQTNSGTVNVQKDTWGNYNVTTPNGSYYLQKSL
ncbi:MAG: hypothetical protein Q4E83_03850 [bacterium]|nr:hypothetical protein [bacterium]